MYDIMEEKKKAVGLIRYSLVCEPLDTRLCDLTQDGCFLWCRGHHAYHLFDWEMLKARMQGDRRTLSCGLPGLEKQSILCRTCEGGTFLWCRGHHAEHFVSLDEIGRLLAGEQVPELTIKQSYLPAS